MKYYLILALIFVLACNSEQDKLQQQLNNLEAQLPQAEADLKEAKKKHLSFLKSVSDKSVAQRKRFLDSLYASAGYKQLRLAYKEDRIDSIKKAIADQKEKIQHAK
ncbi:MAG TPA: hypothetical protein VD794_07655 [Flavisolibacter sp.]|nr:hypothetical protein [Flavisolibacter sp.]